MGRGLSPLVNARRRETQAVARRALELLTYCPLTGVFRWRVQRNTRVGLRLGDVAGRVHASGYCRIKIDGEFYLSHRLAWLLTHGHWPTAYIDHINGNRADNRIVNLRDVSASVNIIAAWDRRGRAPRPLGPPNPKNKMLDRVRARQAGLSIEDLRAAIDYDPITGIFTRNGRVSGYVTPQGYLRINIHKRGFAAHRLAWAYVHGRWPEQFVDHINGRFGDNRIENLREATASQNQANSCRKMGRPKGITQSRGRWIAQIAINGHNTHIGCFDTADEAHAAYAARALLVYGEFARLA